MEKFKDYFDNEQSIRKEDKNTYKKYVYKKPEKPEEDDLSDLDELLNDNGSKEKGDLSDLDELLNNNEDISTVLSNILSNDIGYMNDDIKELNKLLKEPDNKDIADILSKLLLETKRGEIGDILGNILNVYVNNDKIGEILSEILNSNEEENKFIDKKSKIQEERKEYFQKIVGNLENLAIDLQIDFDNYGINIDLVDIATSLSNIPNELSDYENGYGFSYEGIDKLSKMFSDDITDISKFDKTTLIKTYIFIKGLNTIAKLGKNSIEEINYQDKKFHLVELKIQEAIFKKEIKENGLSDIDKGMNLPDTFELDLLILEK